MFEIGSYYTLVYGSHDDSESCDGQCVDWQHPLLKFRFNNEENDVLINISNSSFLRAEVALAPGEGLKLSGTMPSVFDLIKS